MPFEGLARMFGGFSPQKLREERWRTGAYQEGDFNPPDMMQRTGAQPQQTPDMMQRVQTGTAPNAALKPSYTPPDYAPLQKDIQDLEDMVRARNEAKAPTTPRVNYKQFTEDYLAKHGIQHGEEKHKGLKGRFLHGLLGAGLSGLTALSGSDDSNAVGRAIGGGIFGGISGAWKPKETDAYYNRKVIAPRGEAEFQKELVQENLEFERSKRDLDLEQIRGALTGQKQQGLASLINAKKGMIEATANAQNAAVQAARDQQKFERSMIMPITEQVGSGGLATFDPTTGKQSGMIAPYGGGAAGKRAQRSPLSVSAITSLLNGVEGPPDEIAEDSVNRNPGAVTGALATKYGQAKADWITKVRDAAKVPPPTNEELKSGARSLPVYTDDQMTTAFKLYDAAEQEVKAEAKRRTAEKQRAKAFYLWYNGYDPDIDGQMPPIPTDDELASFSDVLRQYQQAPAGGGAKPSSFSTTAAPNTSRKRDVTQFSGKQAFDK